MPEEVTLPGPGNQRGSASTRNGKKTGLWRRFNPWNDPHRHTRYLVDYNDPERERQITRIVDDGGFKTLVFFVAASGFLASSYGLFATNVIMSALFYVYPQNERESEKNRDVIINELTYIGSVLGMLVMGHLADRGGRKKWYGTELAILIVATFGVVQASDGHETIIDGVEKHSMDIYNWLEWWRFLLGVGIGAEYPLSAIITSEWASTEARGTMLAAVFAMQSVARLLAFAVNLGALRVTYQKWALQENYFTNTALEVVIDQTWRWTIGIGIIPASIAILFRLTIPETPRYYAGIKKDLRKAVQNLSKVYPNRVQEDNNHHPAVGATPASPKHDADNWYKGAWQYLNGPEKPWKRLVNISILWAIMDVAWYGLSENSPGALSTLAYNSATNSTAIDLGSPNLKGQDRKRSDNCSGQWNSDCWNPNITIYQMIEENSLRSILIVSVASLAGSLASILLINRFRRKTILTTSFAILTILFAITGSILVVSADDKKNHFPATIFYSIVQFVFNIGPNPLLFVMPAEIFPTVYRGTFYGIAAASGKIGAVIIAAIISKFGNDEKSLGVRLLIFMPLMIVSAVLSWYLPDVQYVPKSSQEGANRTQDPTYIMEMADAPRIAADQRSEVSSDSSIAHDSQPSRSGNAKSSGRFFGRLSNMPLEEIAPNPIWNARHRNGTATGR